MKFIQRTLAAITAIAPFLFLSLLTGAAGAQDYPTKPIRMIVPYPAGGVLDNLARILGTEVAKGLGQPIVVDNRAGASGLIGTAEAARAAPDGYTMLMVYDTHVLYPFINKNLSFDPFKDFAPLALLVKTPLIAMASVNFPPNDLQELVAYAKKNPGKVTYGSTGIGSPPHLSGLLFARATGVSMLHVPYKGGAQAQTDLIGGQINMMIATPALVKGAVASNRVKLLGQLDSRRSAFYPDMKTVTEQGIQGFEVSSWTGLSFPAGTSPAIIERWRKELALALGNPAIAKQLNDMGIVIEFSSPAEFDALMRADNAKWGRLIKEMNITFE